jgi:hypothetical protein
MEFRKRSLYLWVILSIVTCGIMFLVWYYSLLSDMHKNDEMNKCKSPLLVIFLVIITCGFYAFYYGYQAGKVLERKTGVQNLSIIAMLLVAFGLDIPYLQYYANRVPSN